jgi:hypothetical protein
MNNRLVLLLLAISLLAACASPTRTLSQTDIVNSKAEFALSYQKELEQISNKSAKRLRQEYLNPQGEEQSYDVLVLSGGGERGAFGAGFLKGWGKVQEGEHQRPHFDSVTGISAGALIAPFAFVGTEEAYSDIVEIYRNPSEDIVSKRMLLAFLAGNAPYFDTTKLHQQIRNSITNSYVSEIAQKAKQNKVLLVGATNLDYGVMRAWDLSDFATHPVVAKAKEDITTRLIASSAIPGAFSPVEINDYLYVDGGASMQMLTGIDDLTWLYNQDAHFNYVSVDKPLKVRIWLIINNKLELDPDAISPTWSEITKRSIRSLLHSSILQTIQSAETFTKAANQRPELDVEMRFVAIPQDFEMTLSSNIFDKDIMQRLVELGEQMGANPDTWQTKAPRPAASIIDLSYE